MSTAATAGVSCEADKAGDRRVRPFRIHESDREITLFGK